MQGSFITFEGGDGSGKTTQARLLLENLFRHGFNVQLTREPGGTPLASGMRALSLHPHESLEALAEKGLISRELLETHMVPETILPLTEALMLSAARAQHVPRILSWLDNENIVISDRFADATIAYQGYGREYDTEALRMLEALVVDGLSPTITFLLDIDAELGLQRKRLARDRGEEWNRLDQEELAFHKRVRNGYLALAAAEPNRWFVVDARLPVTALEEVIWSRVAEALHLQ